MTSSESSEIEEADKAIDSMVLEFSSRLKFHQWTKLTLKELQELDDYDHSQLEVDVPGKGLTKVGDLTAEEQMYYLHSVDPTTALRVYPNLRAALEQEPEPEEQFPKLKAILRGYELFPESKKTSELDMIMAKLKAEIAELEKE